MEYREITSNVKIPVLGIGTWGIGGRDTADTSRDKESVMALRMALELGMTHIDTAEYYGAGHAEELVGEAIQGWDRDKLFITTKVWHSHLHREALLYSMRASLRRLGVDYVDFYLIHWPNPNVPLLETMRAMEGCIRAGYTRFIGVSNFSAQLMEEAQGLLRENRIIVNQVEYSLIDQKPKMELLPACKRMEVSLVAYRPIGRGSISQSGNQVLNDLAEKYSKSRIQVALNWLISQDGVFSIPKSSNPIHLLELMGSVGWRLTDEEHEQLSNAFI